jgi:hypothetical protein
MPKKMPPRDSNGKFISTRRKSGGGKMKRDSQGRFIGKARR